MTGSPTRRYGICTFWQGFEPRALLSPVKADGQGIARGGLGKEKQAIRIQLQQCILNKTGVKLLRGEYAGALHLSIGFLHCPEPEESG